MADAPGNDYAFENYFGLLVVIEGRGLTYMCVVVFVRNFQEWKDHTIHRIEGLSIVHTVWHLAGICLWRFIFHSQEDHISETRKTSKSTGPVFDSPTIWFKPSALAFLTAFSMKGRIRCGWVLSVLTKCAMG